MSLVNEWFRSSLSLFGQRVVIQVAAALAQLIVIPFLSPSEFGEFLILISVGQLISPFFHFGIPYSITKLVSNYNHDRASIVTILKKHGLLFIVLEVGILSIAIAIFYLSRYFAEGNLFDLQSSLSLSMILIISISIATAGELLISQTLIALNKVSLSAVFGGGLRNIVFLLLLFVMELASELNLILIIKLQIYSALIAAFLAFLMYGYETFKFNKHLINTDIKGNNTKNILSLGFSVMVSNFLTQARIASEPLMIKIFFGLDVAGIIGAARRLVNVANMIANTFGTIIGAYSVRYKDKQEELRKVYIAVSLLSIVICIFPAVVLMIFGGEIIINTLGDSYTSSINYIKIMLLLLAVRFIFGFPNFPLLYLGFPNIVFKANFFFLVITIAVYFMAGIMSSITFAIVGSGLIEALKFQWLWFEAKNKVGMRTDAIPL